LIVVLIELVNDSTAFNLLFTELDRVVIVEFIVVDMDASEDDNEFAADALYDVRLTAVFAVLALKDVATDALNDCVNEFSEAETISKFDTFNVKSDTFPPPDTSNESNLLSTDVENGCMLPTKLIAVLVTPNRYNVELPLA
jgi:hypothetical protein